MSTTMHVSDVAELLSESRTHFNLSPAMLVEHSIRRDEAKLAANGAIVGYTNRTGRSPTDKFIVRDETTDHSIAWGAVNQPFEAEKFDAICAAGSFLCRIFSAAPTPPTACRFAS
jgi:phosphoenolpyruvate carboxykinase (ATP)